MSWVPLFAVRTVEHGRVALTGGWYAGQGTSVHHVHSCTQLPILLTVATRERRERERRERRGGGERIGEGELLQFSSFKWLRRVGERENVEMVAGVTNSCLE